jgi:hypothetical protein
MKRFFFLPRYIVYLMVFAIFFAFWNLSLGKIFLVLLICIAIGSAFRRPKIPFQETTRADGEIFLSPVYGTIKAIRQNVPILNDTEIGHEIRIAISFWNPKGLYLPTTGEVTFLKANKGKKISREAEEYAFYGPLEDVSHTNFTLTSKSQNRSSMRFVDSPYGRRPVIWLKSGDRGRGAACFGYYPLGGTLLIYLPKNSDILVFESEQVIPGQTVIASIKDLN